ncbi:hypothetical protein [Actinomadura roseirufa]|uniref:hypothetical protein n=1 Tax=Actinomadura roseirufa TaxID=2094049 RepID=UPI00104169AE|nr:hypothetical protein [Actinomadura roseirufa]
MNSLVDLPVPSEEEIHATIARRVGKVSADDVRKVLREHGIVLASPLPARRSLCVHRLYCEGVKTDTDDNDGPFTVEYTLAPGAWAFVSEQNSAGKSNLLWALTWALRGEGFEEYQRGDTVAWFQYIRADVEVAGVPVSVRVTLGPHRRVSLALLTADSLQALLDLDGQEDQGELVRTVAVAGDAAAAKDLIGRFMCERLGLRPFTVWAAERGAPTEEGGARDGDAHTHGWPSFFHAIALNAGHDKVLLGPVATGALPVRLLQVFLDVPYVSELTEIKAASKRLRQRHRHGERRQAEDRRVRAARLEPLREELEQARRRLADLSRNAPDVAALVAAVQETSRGLAPLTSAREELAVVAERARKDRIRDERALRQAKESAAARSLLGALDPEICPRCESDIDDARREREDLLHQCAVCTSEISVQAEDADDRARLLADLHDRLTGSRRAEASAVAALFQADDELGAARERHELATAELADNNSAAVFAARQEAAATVHRLEGAMALLRRDLEVAEDEPEEDPADRILEVAEAELEALVTVRSRDLFADVSTELCVIARRLGVTNLSSVDLKLNGTLNARKSGKSTQYRRFSPGERLRMRIAAVVAMISVGQRRGIASHPGLLLIDAPMKEEVVPGDAGMALAVLRDLAEKTDGLQMIITSIEPVVRNVFPDNKIIHSAVGPSGRYMF